MSFAERRSVTLAGRHYADSATGELVGLDHRASCECWGKRLADNTGPIRDFVGGAYHEV